MKEEKDEDEAKEKEEGEIDKQESGEMKGEDEEKSAMSRVCTNFMKQVYIHCTCIHMYMHTSLMYVRYVQVYR